MLPASVYVRDRVRRRRRRRRAVLLYSDAMESSLRQRLLRHDRFTAAVRAFFRQKGYAEVDTPTLSPFLIPEPALEVFQTEYLPARGRARPMWLIPSPELWMKRLLAQGSGNVFQISRSFRNGDYGGPSSILSSLHGRFLLTGTRTPCRTSS